MKTIKHISMFAAAIAVAILLSSTAHAKIWRVNNRSNYNGTTLWGSNFGGTASYPVFNQVNQAVGWGSVKNYDTLHVEGSPFIYAAATITKKLVIIGPGFFLKNNPNTSNDGYDAEIGEINFNTGSGSSSVIGLNVVFQLNQGGLQISADSITIKRCRIEIGITYYTGLKLATVIENFFPNTYTKNAIYLALNNPNPPADFIFNNNICQMTLLWEANSTTLWNITECKNNVFAGAANTLNLAFQTTDFSNNILAAQNATVNISAPTGAIAYNIGTPNNEFGTSDNNLGVATSTLFTAGTSPDGYYQVSPSSAAYKSGSDGTDRGAFGGTIPSGRYTLSGLAPVPVVYSASSTGEVLSNGLQVTVKARTIK